VVAMRWHPLPRVVSCFGREATEDGEMAPSVSRFEIGRDEGCRHDEMAPSKGEKGDGGWYGASVSRFEIVRDSGGGEMAPSASSESCFEGGRGRRSSSS
jgi:hypothetical protein